MKSVRLKLPATSANLGPGFDTLALALGIFLKIEAAHAAEFSIHASGRGRELCQTIEGNLLIGAYRDVLEEEGRPLAPLALAIDNGIPLGMGCGSSAAARLAGIALAVQFGNLGWDSERIVDAAARREGHPDNVAACWFGGLTIAAGGERLSVASISPPPDWKAILVLPDSPVATEQSRARLPAAYSRADAVANIQNASLLTAAFALRRADLLPRAAADRLHQPYRESLCPLLPALLPLAGRHGILSVTLSGAGPSVLLLTGSEADFEQVRGEILGVCQSLGPIEILPAELCGEGAGIRAG